MRAPAIGHPDQTQQASPTDQYATRHNPFVYFHSIIDNAAQCAAHDVHLDRLPADLGSVSTTPSLTFITPDLCHDGHDATCADGGPGGMPAADAFLREWSRASRAPRLSERRPARDRLRRGGERRERLLRRGPRPEHPAPGGQSGGAGGGRTGAVLLSPFIAPGTTSDQQYRHYSLLRSIEDYFAVAHLGYAAAPDPRPFGSDVLTGIRWIVVRTASLRL